MAEKPIEYLLVDAYNVIFSWEELREAAEESLDLARNMLLHFMMNYQAYRGCRLILVFDAYRTAGNTGVIEDQGGVYAVYTREAETADSFIERISYLLGESGKKKKQTVRVVTSDGKEQLIVLGSGAVRVSSEQFKEEVARVSDEISEILARLRKESLLPPLA
jgi:predicted RNA-binding protein with PIN domain